jgi:hypothetical protein
VLPACPPAVTIGVRGELLVVRASDAQALACSLAFSISTRSLGPLALGGRQLGVRAPLGVVAPLRPGTGVARLLSNDNVGRR